MCQGNVPADAPGRVRDYLATVHGGEPNDYQVTVTADLGSVEDDVAAARRRAAQAQAESVAAGERWREVAAVLRQVHHLSVRDTRVRDGDLSWSGISAAEVITSPGCALTARPSRGKQ